MVVTPWFWSSLSRLIFDAVPALCEETLFLESIVELCASGAKCFVLSYFICLLTTIVTYLISFVVFCEHFEYFIGKVVLAVIVWKGMRIS